MTCFEFPGAWYEVIRGDLRDTEAETRFLADLAPTGGSLLDLGCGTGTNVRALAAAGFQVTGVDRSASFIDHAKNTGDGQYVHADAEDYDAEAGAYDCVFSFFGSLNGIDRDQLPSLLQRVHSWLRPGGYVVLDAAPLLGFVDAFQPVTVAHHRRDGYLVTRLGRQLVHGQGARWRNDEVLLVREPDGTVRMAENVVDQSILTTPELEGLLAAAGFEQPQRFGGFRHEPPPPHGKGPLLLVARRG